MCAYKINNGGKNYDEFYTEIGEKFINKKYDELFEI